MRSLRQLLGSAGDRGREVLPIEAVAATPINTLSTLGVGAVADVDERGVVYPRSRPLSVEVWFGVGDRWVRGSPDSGVRQSRVAGLPIVETRQRVGDADIVQTAWADESGDSRGRVVIALANETENAVVAAIVVRPQTLYGAGQIREIRLSGTMIVADKLPIVELSRAPGDSVVAKEAEDDLIDRVALTGNEMFGEESLVDAAGRASLAALVPLTPGIDREIQILDGREAPTVVPAPLDRVVAGWRSHLSEAAEIELPGWPKHIPVALISSLLGAATDAHPPLQDHEWTPADDAAIAVALSGVGLDWAAATVVDRVLPHIQEGRIGRDRWPEVGLACAAIADTEIGAETLRKHADSVIAAAGFVLTNSAAVGATLPLLRAIRAAHGPVAANDAASIGGAPVGPADGVAMARLGIPIPAESAAEVDQILDSASRPLDAKTIGLSLVAMSGLSRRFEPVVPIRSLAGSTWRWPRSACGDSPHARAWLLIGLRSLCLSEYPGGPGGASVTLSTPSDIDVLPGLQSSWLGQNLRFSRLPTSAGSLSIALRWHGERPALLWEFHGESDQPFTLTCLSIDPSWSTSQRSGEALLEAPTHLRADAPKSLL
jgi:hypothetical protein